MAISIKDPVMDFADKPRLDPKFHKKIWTYLSAVLLVVGLAAVVNQVTKRQQVITDASGGVTLSFLATAKEVQVDDAVDVDIYLDTKRQAVTNAFVYVEYPQDLLEPVGISESTFLPVLLEPGKIEGNVAMIHVGNTNPKKGVGPIASLRFRAKAAGSAHLEFSADSTVYNRVADQEAVNLVERAINLVVTIK